MGLADEIQRIDVDALCTEYDLFRKAAPSRSAANKPYFVGHDGRLQAKNPSRPSEDHLAIALWRLKALLPQTVGDPVRLLDYQFPLRVAARPDAGLGDVDLLGATDQGRLAVVELKVQRARSSRGDTPVLALMEGLRYAAVIDANRRAIAAEVRTRFAINVSDEPPIVQVLAPESWWRGWRDMTARTRRVAGKWESEFCELSAQLEARLGVVIECTILQEAELDDITWDEHGPLLEHIPKMNIIRLGEGNTSDADPAAWGSREALRPLKRLDSSWAAPPPTGAAMVSSDQPPYVSVEADLEAQMDAPDENALRIRLETLFCNEDEQATIGTVVQAAIPDDGQWPTVGMFPTGAPEDETFTVQFGREDDGQPKLEHWLCQPNDAFGGRTPEALLTGNEKDRKRLDRFIGALEQGVFS